MSEPPDFDQIARRVAGETGVGRLEEWDASDPDRVVTAIAEQLRLIWNARGAADDYRALLVHYMAHVLATEGVTFTDVRADGTISTYLRTAFSLDETAELRRLAEEAKDVP